jgi:hypothetical protein
MGVALVQFLGVGGGGAFTSFIKTEIDKFLLIDRTFKIIYKLLLLIFHITLIKSWNILTESSKLSAILD